MFHDVKGENVKFDSSRSTASWTPVKSGGLTFVSTPLTSERPLTLTLDGSGAVELGITCTDPACYQDRVPETVDKIREYSFLNDIKIHRRKCEMVIQLDENLQEVITSYGGGQYKHSIAPCRNYFVVVDVKFGAVDMKLDGPDGNVPVEFSEYHGPNIKLLNNPAAVTSLTKSPASVCFYSDPLTPDLQLALTCTPRGYQSTIPGRYYLLLRYVKMEPRQFHIRYPGKFIIQRSESADVSDGDWSQIEKLEKEECTGKPVGLKFTGCALELRSSTGKQKSINCNLQKGEQVWLALELYGISVHIETGNGSELFPCPGIPEELPECHAMSERCDSVEDSLDMVLPTSGRSLVTYVPPPPTPSAQPPQQPQPCRIGDPVWLKDAIQKNFTTILKTFVATPFVDFLYESDMITVEEMEKVHSLTTSAAARYVLIDILSKRPVSKKAVERALKETKQDFLMDILFSNAKE
ncbi:uncharacterized protein LOC127848667 [Dreissena polymorpha]|uniref:CARD domain-containing protein n=1 Tax=Dreissena polymorpha TaxID=45954 RepID=A0A9D4DTP2_DREPO|nr:uncharacterized protein LOC127848667 [Dreissena polymorpha]KAH3755241.1 hypothetical protein DPMN_189931 [Dreissena polymorpha]